MGIGATAKAALLQKTAGLKNEITYNLQTAKAGLLGKKNQEAVRGFANGGSTPTNPSMTVTEVSEPQGQPSTVPVRQPFQPDIGADAYRRGGVNLSGVGTEDGPDDIYNPRTLGAREDRIASISLSVDRGSDIRQQITEIANDQTGIKKFTGDIISAYSRFFLQGVDESDAEKMHAAYLEVHAA